MDVGRAQLHGALEQIGDGRARRRPLARSRKDSTGVVARDRGGVGLRRGLRRPRRRLRQHGSCPRRRRFDSAGPPARSRSRAPPRHRSIGEREECAPVGALIGTRGIARKRGRIRRGEGAAINCAGRCGSDDRSPSLAAKSLADRSLASQRSRSAFRRSRGAELVCCSSALKSGVLRFHKVVSIFALWTVVLCKAMVLCYCDRISCCLDWNSYHQQQAVSISPLDSPRLCKRVSRLVNAIFLGGVLNSRCHCVTEAGTPRGVLRLALAALAGSCNISPEKNPQPSLTSSTGSPDRQVTALPRTPARPRPAGPAPSPTDFGAEGASGARDNSQVNARSRRRTAKL